MEGKGHFDDPWATFYPIRLFLSPFMFPLFCFTLSGIQCIKVHIMYCFFFALPVNCISLSPFYAFHLFLVLFSLEGTYILYFTNTSTILPSSSCTFLLSPSIHLLYISLALFVFQETDRHPLFYCVSIVYSLSSYLSLLPSSFHPVHIKFSLFISFIITIFH